jgi:hypothetical protein
MLGCRCYTIVRESVKRISDLIKYTIDNNKYIKEVVYKIKHKYSFMTGMRIEPLSTPWFYMYSFNKELFLIEKNCEMLFLEDMEKHIFEMALSIPIENLSPLIVIKGSISTGEIYFVRRGPFTNDILPFTTQKSKTRFLSIEYTHPNMNESIELELTDSWYIVGNELFTPSFVFRALEYQSKPFYFDENYTIKVLDNEFNIREFGADMFVELLVDGYIWKQDVSFLGNRDEIEQSEESEESIEIYDSDEDNDKKTI